MTVETISQCMPVFTISMDVRTVTVHLHISYLIRSGESRIEIDVAGITFPGIGREDQNRNNGARAVSDTGGFQMVQL